MRWGWRGARPIAVEQGTDPPVGSQIGPANRLAGPAGPGIARRLVEIDGKPYLLLDRKIHPVHAGKPFQRAPVASDVASKFLGIESCTHGSQHVTADQRSRGEGHFSVFRAARAVRCETRRSETGLRIVLVDTAARSDAIRRSADAPGAGTRPGRGRN